MILKVMAQLQMIIFSWLLLGFLEGNHKPIVLLSILPPSNWDQPNTILWPQNPQSNRWFIAILRSQANLFFHGKQKMLKMQLTLPCNVSLSITPCNFFCILQCNFIVSFVLPRQAFLLLLKPILEIAKLVSA